MNAQPGTIATERLVLAPLDVAHAHALFEALRDPEIYRYVPGDAPRDPSVLALRYRRIAAGPTAPEERWWNWAVATRERPADPFGTVETSLSQSGLYAMLGYRFGRSAWGRGFAFEACDAAIAYLRRNARTERIDAYVDTRNERSIRLAERLGMHRVETILGADCFKGSSSDEYHFRLVWTDQKDNDGKT